MITRYLLPLISVGLLAFAIYYVAQAKPQERPATLAAPPPRSPFADTLAGAGMIEPETENISIGSHVPGIVVEVSVKVGDRLQPGDELFRLDDRQLKAELNYRRASLAAAQAELARWDAQPRKEQIPIAQAQVREAEAGLVEAEDQLSRMRQLVAAKARTKEELVAAEQGYQSAAAQTARAQAELDMLLEGAWEFDKRVAAAAVDQAQAQVEQVQTELDRLAVRSLVEGQVLQVNIRPGEFVGAPPSQPLSVLGSVRQLHVRVDIDEHDIPRFHPGMPAVAMLKGHSEESFPLKFVRVEPYVIPKRSLTGENTERVDTRVLQVIYAVEAAGRPLYVGQQVDVFMDADTRGDRKRTDEL